MSNPEPPPATPLAKVRTLSYAKLRAAAQERQLVMDNIDAVLKEFCP